MLGGLKENKAIKNSIVKIANKKAEKMNQSDDTEEEEIKITNINLKSTKQNSSNNDDVGNMDMKDIWDMFK